MHLLSCSATYNLDFVVSNEFLSSADVIESGQGQSLKINFWFNTDAEYSALNRPTLCIGSALPAWLLWNLLHRQWIKLRHHWGNCLTSKMLGFSSILAIKWTKWTPVWKWGNCSSDETFASVVEQFYSVVLPKVSELPAGSAEPMQRTGRFRA